MRIAVVSPWGSPCGISVYSGDVYGELARRGHTIQVFAMEESLPAATPAEVAVTRNWAAGQAPSWRFAIDLQQFHPDTIHVQHEIGFFSPLAVWREWLDCLRRFGVPVIVTYHSVPDAPTSITDLPVSAAVVCSPVGASLLESRVSFPVYGIEHGVDGPIPTDRQPEPRSLVTFGFLAECKGYERILKAMAELRSELPDLTLTIMGSLTSRALAGQMDYFQRLHHQIAAMGLTGRVDISCGFRTLSEVRSVLSRKAVGVLHYDRTDRLIVSGLGETAESAEYSPAEVLGTTGVLSCASPSDVRGTTQRWPGAPAATMMLGTTGPFGAVSDSHQGHKVQPGRAGIRCQSAAIFRMWSAGVPCIVSQAQHFDLGPTLRKALIRADSDCGLTEQIRRLCTSSEAYSSACEAVSTHVTRRWTDVADDHERVYADLNAASH
ncbi:MAG TPA: glycosyltransferase [Planctomycetaceae bacterium]|nr:glycosyltransferase [Planctomycetaceae bacterium]